jgi:mevalonate kinase
MKPTKTFCKKNTLQAKIPGSLMLMGEHAVLHGGLAIACAVDRFIKVTLTPRSDNQINIASQKFGNLSFFLSFPDNKISKDDKNKFKFVLAAIASKQSKISSGFDLKIEADFSPQLGLGSSAAVTVATLIVLEQWISGIKPQQLKLVKDARKIIQKVQGTGSGADVAASVYGGVVSYKMQPLKITKLKNKPPLTVIYSGSKVPTPKVIAIVKTSQQKYPKIFKQLYAAISCCAEQAVTAINSSNWKKLGDLMNIHQGLQDALGVNNKILSELIYKLRADSKIHGAKISGSGLGDCVIGLGKI